MIMAFSKLDALASVAELIGANDDNVGCGTQKRGIRKRVERKAAKVEAGDFTTSYERRERPYSYGIVQERVELAPEDAQQQLDAYAYSLNTSYVASAQSQHTMSVALPMPRSIAPSHFSGGLDPASAYRTASLSEPGAPPLSCAASKRCSPSPAGSPQEAEDERLMHATKRRSVISAGGIAVVQPYDLRFATAGAEEDECLPRPNHLALEEKALLRQPPAGPRRSTAIAGATHRLRYSSARPSPAGSGASDEPCNSSGGGANAGTIGYTRNRTSVASLPAAPFPPTPARAPQPVDCAPAAARALTQGPRSSQHPNSLPSSRHGATAPAARVTSGVELSGDPVACLSMMAQSPSKGGPDLLEKMRIAQTLLMHRDKLHPQWIQLVVQQLDSLCQSASVDDLVARMASSAPAAPGVAEKSSPGTSEADPIAARDASAAGISPANSGSTAGGGRMRREPVACGPRAAGAAAAAGTRTGGATALVDYPQGPSLCKADAQRCAQAARAREAAAAAAGCGSLWQDESPAQEPDAHGSTSSSSSSRTATRSTEPHAIGTGSTLSGPALQLYAPPGSAVPVTTTRAPSVPAVTGLPPGRCPSSGAGPVVSGPHAALAAPRMAGPSLDRHSRGYLPPHADLEPQRGLCGHDSVDLNNAACMLVVGGSGQLPGLVLDQEPPQLKQAHGRPLLPPRLRQNLQEPPLVPVPLRLREQQQQCEGRLEVPRHRRDEDQKPPSPSVAPQRLVEQPQARQQQLLGLDLSAGGNATTSALIAALTQRVRPSGGSWQAGDVIAAGSGSAEAPAGLPYYDDLVQLRHAACTTTMAAPSLSSQLPLVRGRRQLLRDGDGSVQMAAEWEDAGAPRPTGNRYDIGDASGTHAMWRSAAAAPIPVVAPKGVHAARRAGPTMGPQELPPYRPMSPQEDMDFEMQVPAAAPVRLQRVPPATGLLPRAGPRARVPVAPPGWPPVGPPVGPPHYSTGANRCSSSSAGGYGGRQSAFLYNADTYGMARLSETGMPSKSAAVMMPSYTYKMQAPER